MMKTKKWMALIALVAIIAGLIGVIVCLVPGQTDSGKVVAKYVAAINKGDIQTLKSMDFTTVMAQAMGSQMGGAGLGDLEDLLDGDSNESASGDAIYTALGKSIFDIADRLPEGFQKIESVKVIGCADGEPESLLGLTGYSVEVALELTYVDAEGQTKTITEMEDIGLIFYNKQYYVAG